MRREVAFNSVLQSAGDIVATVGNRPVSNRPLKEIRSYVDKLLSEKHLTEVKCEVFAKSSFRLISASSSTELDVVREQERVELHVCRPNKSKRCQA